MTSVGGFAWVYTRIYSCMSSTEQLHRNERLKLICMSPLLSLIRNAFWWHLVAFEAFHFSRPRWTASRQRPSVRDGGVLWVCSLCIVVNCRCYGRSFRFAQNLMSPNCARHSSVGFQSNAFIGSPAYRRPLAEFGWVIFHGIGCTLIDCTASRIGLQGVTDLTKSCKLTAPGTD